MIPSYVISPTIWTSGEICLGLQSPDGRLTCVTSFASVAAMPGNVCCAMTCVNNWIVIEIIVNNIWYKIIIL